MKPDIKVTPAAIHYIEGMMQSAPSGTIGLRFGLKSAGCSGFSYLFNFTNEEVDNDHIIPFGNLKIIINKKFLAYLNGTVIDCVTEGLNETLKFLNPNAQAECGCGESVSIVPLENNG